MKKNEVKELDLLLISKKDSYSEEEKNSILKMLNTDRRKEQEEKVKSQVYSEYSKEEKEKILNQLNSRRLSQKTQDEIKRRRTYNKKQYQFGAKYYYKFLNMEREYYIDISECSKISSRPNIITLYYKVFGELKKKDFLMKVEVYSEKIFISNDILRIHFKGYSFEDDS